MAFPRTIQGREGLWGPRGHPAWMKCLEGWDAGRRRRKKGERDAQKQMSTPRSWQSQPPLYHCTFELLRGRNVVIVYGINE